MTTLNTRPPRWRLPKPDADFYQVTRSLSDAEQEVLKRVRTFMEAKVAPIINKYWAEDSFPFELIPGIRDLKIAGAGYEGYGCAGGSTLLAGFIADGNRANRLLLRDVLRRPQRPGDGVDLPVRVRRAETKMAAADGSAGKDRLLWIDGAPGRLRRLRRPY